MSTTVPENNANRPTSAQDSVTDSHAPTARTGDHGCEVECHSIRQEVIRVVAYAKWQAAGCPAGDGFDFWLEAEREINAERPKSQSAQEQISRQIWQSMTTSSP